MSDSFNPQKRIYDLYSFDAPYDLEPIGLSDIFRDYAEELASDNPSISANRDDGESEDIDLTFEETEPKQHSSDSGLPLFAGQDKINNDRPKPSPALGATLSQRKELLKQRLEELTADIHKREKLEQQMLEKADIETTGLEHLLGNVKNFSPGNYPSVDGRRTNLEREIITLKKAGWDERLRCWRDLVAMKKELREALEEYHLILSAEGL